ncbi:TetR family transcriptional regulator [Mumia sp. DW29H23]|uniref:TetR family transcriptional regulator n=1 Tax=Mumia sp. DW29H23 TaxID=3421241 RepID=UPI003D69C84F
MTSLSRRELASSARPGSARSDEILTTAARLFQESGYATTTIHDIADAVGVLPGSLYHHFASKEDIAIGLLSRFGRDLNEVGLLAARRVRTHGGSPEELVAELTSDVVALSFRSAAAIRLRAYEAPPSVASERLAAAMQLGSPALARAWRDAIARLAPKPTHPTVDRGLLGFTLGRLAFYASTYYPVDTPPRELASHLCDVVLHGVATTSPTDEELEASAAYATATEIVAGWKREGSSDPSDVKETVVAAARAEFARRGYAATTIRDVAHGAGVGMATLYRRFDSKEALLREILDAYAGRLDHAFDAVMRAGSGESETLSALARVFVRASREYREESLIVNLGWTGRETPTSPFHDYYLATQNRLQALEELTARGITSGAWRPVADPHELGFHFRSVMWTPYHEHARSSEARAYAFVRQSLIRGAVDSD